MMSQSSLTGIQLILSVFFLLLAFRLLLGSVVISNVSSNSVGGSPGPPRKPFNKGEIMLGSIYMGWLPGVATELA